MSRCSCSIRNLVVSLLIPIATINAAMIPVSSSGSATEIFSQPQSRFYPSLLLLDSSADEYSYPDPGGPEF